MIIKQNKNIMRSFIYFFIAAGLIVLQSCSGNEKKAKQNEVEKKVMSVPSFKVTTVVSAQPNFSVTLPGELLPYEQVNIYACFRSWASCSSRAGSISSEVSPTAGASSSISARACSTSGGTSMPTGRG